MKVSELITLMSAHLPAQEEVEIVVARDNEEGDVGISIMAGDRALKVVNHERYHHEDSERFGGFVISTFKSVPLKGLIILSREGQTLLDPAEVDEE